MSFIADRIRIAKDGAVSEIAEPTAQGKGPAVTWTPKALCYEICSVSQNCDAPNAEIRLTKLFKGLNMRQDYIDAFTNWIQSTWKNTGLEKRIYVITDYIHRKVP